MFKIRIVKRKRPILDHFVASGENAYPVYKCSSCKANVADDYICCPYCRTELKWERATRFKLRNLLDLL